MFQCQNKHCKKFFEDPIMSKVEPDTGYCELTCPHCGSDDFEDANLCPCGMNHTTEDFCEDCYEQVRLSLDKLKEDLGFTQDDFEQIISNHFGW